jgi:hypothetical protein
MLFCHKMHEYSFDEEKQRNRAHDLAIHRPNSCISKSETPTTPHNSFAIAILVIAPIRKSTLSSWNPDFQPSKKSTIEIQSLRYNMWYQAMGWKDGSDLTQPVPNGSQLKRDRSSDTAVTFHKRWIPVSYIFNGKCHQLSESAVTKEGNYLWMSKGMYFCIIPKQKKWDWTPILPRIIVKKPSYDIHLDHFRMCAH